MVDKGNFWNIVCFINEHKVHFMLNVRLGFKFKINKLTSNKVAITQ